jgi:hypothetical protein
MKWINALGLLLQFISFWFAAPELLGVNTLKRFESTLRKFVASLPLIILLAFILVYAVSMSVLGIMKGLKASEVGLEKNEMLQVYTIMGICLILYFVFLFFFKRIKNWLDIHLAQPLVSGLINNNKTRSSALIVGAILFTIGFLLQLVVIFLA